MEKFLVNTSNDEFKIVASSSKAEELSKILIESFKDFSQNDRKIFSNNTFMVSHQVTSVHGNDIVEKMKEFNHDDWRIAWHIVDIHFYNLENPLNF